MPPRLVPANKGYAYAVRRADGLIKIGHSTDFKNRLPSIRYQIGMSVEHVFSISGRPAEVKSIEQLAHRIAADVRVEGEWFRLTEEEAVRLLERAAGIYIEGGPSLLRKGNARPPLNNRRPGLRVSCFLDPALEKRLSDWRAKQPKIPAAGAAIVELLSRALDLEDRAGLTSPASLGDNEFSPRPRERVDGKRRWSAPTVT